MVIYLAHWFAKRGTKVGRFWGGTVPFLIVLAPILALVFKEPDLGTTTVIALTAFGMLPVSVLGLGLLVGAALRVQPSSAVSSLEVVETNPFLDDRIASATFAVELVQSAFGKRCL